MSETSWGNLGKLPTNLKEETNMKKIMSLLLCAILVCSMAVAASAEYEEDEDENEDPHAVVTAKTRITHNKYLL